MVIPRPWSTVIIGLLISFVAIFATVIYLPLNDSTLPLLVVSNVVNNPIENDVVKTYDNHCSSTISIKSIKNNPSFSDVAQAGCENNPYVGKQVRWQAQVSNYAHTDGIRFRVVDKDHPDSDIDRNAHGLFWGTFLASAKVGTREDASWIKGWSEKWGGSWVSYIMDTYGNIDYYKTTATDFMVTAVIDYVDCDALYDGCYIETTVKKIKEVK